MRPRGGVLLDGQHSCCHYKMYRAGADKRGIYGSQIWILHEFSHLVTAVNVVSPRIIRVCMQLGPVFLHVISAHAPTEVSSDESRAGFWQTLTTTIESTGDRKTNLVVVGVDARGRVGSIPCAGIGRAEPEK